PRVAAPRALRARLALRAPHRRRDLLRHAGAGLARVRGRHPRRRGFGARLARCAPFPHLDGAGAHRGDRRGAHVRDGLSPGERGAPLRGVPLLRGRQYPGRHPHDARGEAAGRGELQLLPHALHHPLRCLPPRRGQHRRDEPFRGAPLDGRRARRHRGHGALGGHLPPRRIPLHREPRAARRGRVRAGARRTAREDSVSTPFAMALEDLLHPLLGRYLGAPRWIKATAGQAYSWLPPRIRLGGAYERFRGEVDVAGEGECMRQLEATLRWALETVPAYRAFRGILDAKRDPRDALLELPVTDKLDIKRHPSHYLSSLAPRASRLQMFTGGSTRNPLQFYVQKHVTRPKEAAFIQAFRARAGVERGARVLALRGRTVPSAAEPRGRIWMHEP